MKKSVSLGIAVTCSCAAGSTSCASCFGWTVPQSYNISAASGTPAKPFISATVSSTTPLVGEPVTISGVATGGNLASGVQIWIFAGNYVNVTTVPVNADGTFSKTYQTTGLPPATYYVFVQSPGPDGIFDIDLYRCRHIFRAGCQHQDKNNGLQLHRELAVCRMQQHPRHSRMPSICPDRTMYSPNSRSS